MLWSDLPDDVLLQDFMQYILPTYVGHTPDPDYVPRGRGTGRRRGVRRDVGRGAGCGRGQAAEQDYMSDTTMEPLRRSTKGW